MPMTSMTGFGSASGSTKGVVVEVDVKSVNHRFLDVVQKLPRHFVRYELDLRDLIAKNLQRGRVELYVSRTILPGEFGEGAVNMALFEKLLGDYKAALKRAGIKDGVSPGQLALEILRRPDVAGSSTSEREAKGERELLFSVAKEALSHLVGMRRAEGKKLDAEIRKRIRALKNLRVQIGKRAPLLPTQARQRLEARLSQTAGDVVIDPARLAQELCLFADKLDVTEELVRISSHLDQWEGALVSEPLGRRFDFLAQELGREFNTIGNKVQDATVQSWVIEGKLELEKIREQIQNVE